MSRILLVDDDATLRTTLRLTLERLGHAVTEVGDGFAAIARQHVMPCEIILIDILMPGRDGLETIRDLRRAAPHAVIVAMSGGGRIAAGSYLEVARHLGAREILEKPFTVAQLATVLDRAGAGPDFAPCTS